MSKRLVRSVLLVLSLAAIGVSCAAVEALADALPLPPGLVALTSPQGEKDLVESASLEAYFPLSITFVSQKTQAYCGVASTVMVLNALHVAAPSTPEYQPYHTFTQDNVLDSATDAVLPRDLLAHHGMTLDQLGAILSLRSVRAEVHHAADGGLEAFRAAARAALGAKDRFVIVNYLRKALGQQTGGHISPLAAYDDKADSFLILDVARYKYPPVWVKTSDLFAAMNTPDAANAGKTRGYVLVAKDEAAAAGAKP